MKCTETDCPYYDRFNGHHEIAFYESLDVPKNERSELDRVIRTSCNLCIYNPDARTDMKSWVIKMIAKRLLE